MGSFELVAHSASLDVASKLIEPPAYRPHYSEMDSVREHQLNFLALDLNTNKEQVKEQLENFGKDLKRRIRNNTFSWKGIGKLEDAGSKMIFHPDVLEIKGLQPLPAEKVLRKNVQHAVLRGEQEVMSASFYDEEKKVKSKRVNVSLIGWIVVFIAIAFIVAYLFNDGLKTSASGTKMKVVPDSAAPSHK